ncbi:hypothetical protein [Paradesulfitobacterium ferrireducens]|nr:hypothetical protein [Paradesulfitobacterium ferrireducens]
MHIFLLPFIKPAMVQPHFADQSTEPYEDAAKAVVQKYGDY